MKPSPAAKAWAAGELPAHLPRCSVCGREHVETEAMCRQGRDPQVWETCRIVVRDLLAIARPTARQAELQALIRAADYAAAVARSIEWWRHGQGRSSTTQKGRVEVRLAAGPR